MKIRYNVYQEVFMKRYIIICIFCALIQNINGQNQTLPIIGYAQMEWGTTIDIFMSLYLSAKDITFGYTGYSRTPNFRVFRQEYIGNNSGKTLTYFFYQNKLYKVEEYFWGMEDSERENFVNEMVLIYGAIDNTSVRRESEGNAYWDHSIYEIYYDSELFVIVGIKEFYRRQDNTRLGNEIYRIFLNKNIDLIVESIRR